MKAEDVRAIVASLPPVPDELTVESFKGLNGEPLVTLANATKAVEDSGGALMIISAENCRLLGRPIEVREGVLDIEIWARIVEASEGVQ